ncbi:MAG TPA: hypothetical protein VFP84_23705 [Kofleriaceae bacterium]|nr:hypothetical protein [Kofleriaceae bacterium]
MATRYRIAIDLNVAISAATEDDLAALQREPLAHVRPRRIDQHEARFANLARRLDGLDLRDACLPLAHAPNDDPTLRDRVAFESHRKPDELSMNMAV